MQTNILMKQLEHANPDPVINKLARIRKILLTAVITSETVIKEQSVLKANILIRRQNTAKTSVQPAVRIRMIFHSADSAKKKVKFCSLIVNPILFVEMGI
jgi:hypothetical protein